ncbi:MAG: epoxyqueuosine reductase [Desulfatibacillum sp.]|nr:epoxyqueuosine reductase [Desulfatibacillum sp.]
MTGFSQNTVLDFLKPRVNRVGFAPVSRFSQAPDEHHPQYALDNAQTVIVFGMAVPRGILHSANRSLYALHRSYHSVYMLIDEISLSLANFMEGKGGALAVPAPSYAPMVFHDMEPWGVLSLKHAAVQAGLGHFGKNQLVHNKDFGTMLRFGAVVTTAQLAGDPLEELDPCPKGCDLCAKACPSQAILEDGFRKMNCLGHTIKHAIYPLALNTPEGIRNIERVINTAGHNYWITCHECLSVCPGNARSKKVRG